MYRSLIFFASSSSFPLFFHWKMVSAMPTFNPIYFHCNSFLFSTPFCIYHILNGNSKKEGNTFVRNRATINHTILGPMRAHHPLNQVRIIQSQDMFCKHFINGSLLHVSTESSMKPTNPDGSSGRLSLRVGICPFEPFIPRSIFR